MIQHHRDSGFGCSNRLAYRSRPEFLEVTTLIVDRIAEAGNLAAFRFFVNDFSTPTQLLAGHPDIVQKGPVVQ